MCRNTTNTESLAKSKKESFMSMQVLYRFNEILRIALKFHLTPESIYPLIYWRIIYRLLEYPCQYLDQIPTTTILLYNIQNQPRMVIMVTVLKFQPIPKSDFTNGHVQFCTMQIFTSICSTNNNVQNTKKNCYQEAKRAVKTNKNDKRASVRTGERTEERANTRTLP